MANIMTNILRLKPFRVQGLEGFESRTYMPIPVPLQTISNLDACKLETSPRRFSSALLKA